MLLTRGANTYTNDENGNQLTGGGRANTWDSQNRLRTCVTAQHTSAFTYAADGLRRQTVLDGQVTTQYTLDSSMVIRENTTGGENASQVTYLCGPRGPEYRRAGAGEDPQVTWYCYDGLGSVLAEVSSTGYITGARQMDVYGAPRATQGSPTSKHAFVGGLGHPTEDNTGLIYMRARWMDPVTGTFVSEDPAGHGVNWFVYCSSSPVSFTDTNGQEESWRNVAIDGLFGCGADIMFELRAGGFYTAFLRTCSKTQAVLWLLEAGSYLLGQGWAYDGTATELYAAARAEGQMGNEAGYDALSAAAGVAAGKSIQCIEAGHNLQLLAFFVLATPD
jgi:RHS repeat-associated protein